ncbi:MAG: hypothetical protein ACLTDX_01595 [[Clostridium] innocuum]
MRRSGYEIFLQDVDALQFQKRKECDYVTWVRKRQSVKKRCLACEDEQGFTSLHAAHAAIDFSSALPPCLYSALAAYAAVRGLTGSPMISVAIPGCLSE